MRQSNQTHGFTLVELMLSMAFVAILLVAVGGTTTQITHIYTKGVTIREVNQAGRLISDDLQRTVSSSAPFTVTPANGVDSKYVTRPGGGRLCTGSYTYAWNYGKTRELSGITGLPNVYNTYVGSATPIRFVKVTDTGGALCANPNTMITIASAKELLMPGDRNLAIQEFNVAAGSRDDVANQALYGVAFTLGTNDKDGRELLVANGKACVAPSSMSSNDDFCAVNQFEIVLRAGNRPGSQ